MCGIRTRFDGYSYKITSVILYGEYQLEFIPPEPPNILKEVFAQIKTTPYLISLSILYYSDMMWLNTGHRWNLKFSSFCYTHRHLGSDGGVSRIYNRCNTLVHVCFPWCFQSNDRSPCNTKTNSNCFESTSYFHMLFRFMRCMKSASRNDGATLAILVCIFPLIFSGEVSIQPQPPSSGGQVGWLVISAHPLRTKYTTCNSHLALPKESVVRASFLIQKCD